MILRHRSFRLTIQALCIPPSESGMIIMPTIKDRAACNSQTKEVVHQG